MTGGCRCSSQSLDVRADIHGKALPKDPTMAYNRFAALFAVTAFLFTVPAAAQQRPNDVELAQMLRAGGYVIVVRHGATHADQADTDPLNHENLAKQRQLNA